MVDFLIILSLISLGVVFAVITAIIGVGAGLLTVPTLIFVFGVNPIDATLISTFTLVFGRSSSFIKYKLVNRIDFKSGLIFLIFAIPGSILGSYFAERIDEILLTQIFGILIGIVSLRGLFQLYFDKNEKLETPINKELEDESSRLASIKENNENKNYRRIIDSEGDIYTYLVDLKYTLPLSFVSGFISGLLGIGGGIFLIPVMNTIGGIPIHVTVATSTFMIMIMTLVALITRLIDRNAMGEFNLIYLLSFGLPLALGSILGGFIGASQAKRFNPNQLKILFWIIGLLASIKMIF